MRFDTIKDGERFGYLGIVYRKIPDTTVRLPNGDYDFFNCIGVYDKFCDWFAPEWEVEEVKKEGEYGKT